MAVDGSGWTNYFVLFWGGSVKNTCIEKEDLVDGYEQREK